MAKHRAIWFELVVGNRIERDLPSYLALFRELLRQMREQGRCPVKLVSADTIFNLRLLATFRIVSCLAVYVGRKSIRDKRLCRNLRKLEAIKADLKEKIRLLEV